MEEFLAILTVQFLMLVAEHVISFLTRKPPPVAA